jgi:predicted ATPase
LPVKKNLDFIRKVEDVIKTESYIAKFNPELLSDFEDIIGGDYKVGKEGLYYTPKTNKSIKLSMGESSSSVRSLLDIGFYLRHIAEKGDILMIDEPELNLHPCNQRRLAKLFARLINVGVNVFITTHSDYIIKELNTLIMLNATKESEFTKELMRKYSYIESELINSTQVKVYISEIAKVLIDGKSKKSSIQTLVPAEIDSFYGIEARSFDKTILQMNEIQESIVLGR